MAGAVVWLESRPTYETADNLALTNSGAGIVVEGRAGSKIGIAAAGSLKVVGIAVQDAVAKANQAALLTGTTSFGAFPLINADGVINEFVEVVQDAHVRVNYTLAANFGDALIVGTVAGNVSPAGVTPDARSVIGWCSEPGGVGAAAVGLMKITR